MGVVGALPRSPLSSSFCVCHSNFHLPAPVSFCLWPFSVHWSLCCGAEQARSAGEVTARGVFISQGWAGWEGPEVDVPSTLPNGAPHQNEAALPTVVTRTHPLLASFPSPSLPHHLSVSPEVIPPTPKLFALDSLSQSLLLKETKPVPHLTFLTDRAPS